MGKSLEVTLQSLMYLRLSQLQCQLLHLSLGFLEFPFKLELDSYIKCFFGLVSDMREWCLPIQTSTEFGYSV